MDFLLLFSVLLFLLRTTYASSNQGVELFYESPLESSPFWRSLKHQFLRSKRSSPYRITECVFVTSEENFYYHKAETNSYEVCGIYLFTDPDKVIEIHFDHLNVPCATGGVVTFFDGWELGGKFFPGEYDDGRPFLQRYNEFCGVEGAEKVFVTTQNAGMLHYRLPAKGKGFSFYLKFLKNPAPCNILAESKEDFYTLRNHGKARNCTLMAVFPAKIKVLAFSVGGLTSLEGTRSTYQCGKEKMMDRLQIGGSKNLDSSRFVLFEDICGLGSSDGMDATVVGCDVTVVRLVSSGQYDNFATFKIEQPNQIELLKNTFPCEV